MNSNDWPERTPTGRVDALVVGAGPAGSVAAYHLARAGLRVVVADRAAFPREKICSEYMSPAAVQRLDRLGVLADLEPLGSPRLAGTTVTTAGGSVLRGEFARAQPAPYRPTGLAVARRLLDARLLAAAREAGAIVLERAAAEDLLYREGAVAGAVVRGPDGARHALHARLTIGADGLRSVVARRMGRRRQGRLRRLAFVAHVAGVRDLTDLAELHVGRDGYVGINPLGGAVANVALVVPEGRAREARGDVAGFFYRTLDQFAPVRGRVPREGQVRPVLVTGPFSAWSRRVVADGALLVGDAAEFFDPFTGEGIASALIGAELAAEAALPVLLSGGLPTAARLAGYRRARRRAFAGRWAVERLVGYGMLLPGLFNRAVDRLGRRPPMADTFIGVTGDFVPASAILNPRFLLRMVW